MISLRDYQQQTTADILEFYESGAKRLLAVLPCGAGKTVTAVNVCNNFKRVLWLAHRHELLDQAEEAFIKTSRHDVIYHSIFKQPEDWGYIDLVVLDEAHHESCRTIRDLLKDIEFDKLLGLTATPDRADNLPLQFEYEIVGISNDELVDDGWLCEPWLYSIRCFTPDYVDSVASWVSYYKHRIGPTIIFTSTILEAERLAHQLGDLTTEIVTGKSNRQAQLNAYNDDNVQFLLSCAVLTEGTDLPKTQTVILARNTSSKPLMTQMIGRSLRLHDMKTHAKIVETIPVGNCRNGLAVANVISPRRRFVSCINEDYKWRTYEFAN